jgi:hypothetical protein
MKIAGLARFILYILQILLSLSPIDPEFFGWALWFLDHVQIHALDFLRNFEIAGPLLRHSHCLGGLFTFPN